MFKQRFPVFYFPLYFLFTRLRHVLRFLLFLFPGIDPICNCLLQGEAYASVSVFALIPFRTRVNPVLFVVTVPASFVDISFFYFSLCLFWIPIVLREISSLGTAGCQGGRTKWCRQRMRVAGFFRPISRGGVEIT